MDDNELNNELNKMREDLIKGESNFIGDFFKAMFILLLIFGVLAGVGITIEDLLSDTPTSWDTMENVTFKQISYDSRYHENRYFIFTDNYCFDVTDLKVYNNISVGDQVNVTVDKYNLAYLNYGDHIFNNE